MPLPRYDLVLNEFSNTNKCGDWCGGTFLRYGFYDWAGLTNQLLFTLQMSQVAREMHSVLELRPILARNETFQWDPKLKKSFDEVNKMERRGRGFLVFLFLCF
jgi:hypothetical protein